MEHFCDGLRELCEHGEANTELEGKTEDFWSVGGGESSCDGGLTSERLEGFILHSEV